MASASKSVTLTAPVGGSVQYRLTASFTENSTSTTNNTSSVTCSASLSSLNSSSWSSSTNSTLTIYWHDNRENYDRKVSSTSFSSLSGGSSKSTSGTITVTHNTNGSLSGYAYAKFTKGGTSSYTPASNGVSTSWTALTNIPRAATVTSAPNINDETYTFEVSFNNPAGYNTHPYLNFYLNGVMAKRIERDTARYTSPYQWEITAEEMAELRTLLSNQTSCQVNIGFDTYNGSTAIGYNSKAKTFSIINANPTFNAAYLDTNSTTTTITGNNQQLIRNNSTLQINVSNATALKEATLSSITTEINGVTYTSTLSGGSATFNIGTLNISENIAALVTLTDSRGLTATQTLNLQMLNWELPTGIVTLQRQNNFYSNTDIKVDADYYSLDGHNTITIKTRYKKITDQSYGNYVTLQDNVTSTITLDNNYQWDVQVLVQDRLGSTTYNLTIDRGIPIIYFDRTKRSMGINCFPQNNESLEISGKDILGILGINIDTWTSGATYNAGILVAYNKSIYENLTGTNSGTPDTDTTNWIEISLMDAINEIKNAEVYSTSETKTNKIWLNGKPIYRKVFEWTNTGIQNGTELSAPISNIGVLTSLEVSLRNIGDLEMFPLINASGKPLQCQYVKSTQKLKFIGTDSWGAGANRTITAIVEYTKA